MWCFLVFLIPWMHSLWSPHVHPFAGCCFCLHLCLLLLGHSPYSFVTTFPTSTLLGLRSVTGDMEEKKWSSVMRSILGSGSSNSVWFPWKTSEKYGDEELCECSASMSVVQVKSKPACVALQAPPWSSWFRLFSCVATRNVARTKGECLKR